MPAREVLAVLRILSARRIHVWIDGGWGVDALLRRQTRRHGDLDLVVEQRHVTSLLHLLRRRGYARIIRDDTRWWNFVIGNKRGHRVDLHVVTFNKTNDGVYGPPAREVQYPASAFQAKGFIAGKRVACLSAAYQLQSHNGYPKRHRDIVDVRRLVSYMLKRGMMPSDPQF